MPDLTKSFPSKPGHEERDEGKLNPSHFYNIASRMLQTALEDDADLILRYITSPGDKRSIGLNSVS